MSWSLYITDRLGVRQAPVDTYESAEILGRVNDVSTWTVTLPTETDAGRYLLTDAMARLEFVVTAPGAGGSWRADTYVMPTEEIWRSGPVVHLERAVDVDGDMLTVSGVDDSVWLARRLAHPQPTTAAPPYSTYAYHVNTGDVASVLAEYVRWNAGPNAVTARKVPGLLVPAVTAAGPIITVSARWQNLLTLLQDTARPHGILFDVVDLTFRAYPAVNRGAVFSEDLETLAGFVTTAEAATANKVVVAGGGVGTARIIRESSHAESVATWGLAETFEDRRDTTDTAELDKAAAEALAAGVLPVTVVFNPIDTEAQTFGRDWLLGDIVTVTAGGLTVIDQIREVHVTLDGDGATVIPSVGKPAGDLALFRSLAGLDRRVRQLERI